MRRADELEVAPDRFLVEASKQSAKRIRRDGASAPRRGEPDRLAAASGIGGTEQRSRSVAACVIVDSEEELCVRPVVRQRALELGETVDEFHEPEHKLRTSGEG